MLHASRSFLATASAILIGGGLISNPQRAAAAIVIDDFTQGALVQSATNYAGVTTLQTGLNPASTLGGTRSVYAGSLKLAEESIETGKGRFHFTANQDYGYFQLDWGSVAPLNVNLSAGGNNRFLLELVDTTPNFSAAILELRVKCGNTWFNYDFKNDLASALGGQTFGLLNIPFAKFAGADFTQVQALELSAARVPAGLHLGIDYFSVVPEPTAPALFSLAILGAGLFRRRNCH